MLEEIHQTLQKVPLDFVHITEAMRKISIEYQNHRDESIFPLLFTFVQDKNKPKNVDDKDWSRFLFLLLSLIYDLHPKSEFLSQYNMPIISYNSPLFQLCTLYYVSFYGSQMREDISMQSLDYLMNYFEQCVNQIIVENDNSKNDEFYKIGTTYYTKLLIVYVASFFHSYEKILNNIVRIYDSFIKCNNITEPNMLMLTELLKIWMPQNKASELLKSMLDKHIQCSNSLFFVNAVKVAIFKNNDYNSVEFMENLASKICLLLHMNDLLIFPFPLNRFLSILPKINDKKGIYDIITIINLVNGFNYNYGVSFKHEQIQSLINFLYKNQIKFNYCANGSGYSLLNFCKVIRKIKYPTIDKNTPKFINFMEQSRNKNNNLPIDKKLYTKFDTIVCKSKEETKNVFERDYQFYVYIIQSNSSSLLSCLKFCVEFLRIINDENDLKRITMFTDIIIVLTKFFIKYSYRTMLLQQYINTDIKEYQKDGFVQSKVHSNDRLLPFAKIEIKSIFSQFKNNFVKLATSAIAETLFKYLKKKILTLHFLHLLFEMIPDYKNDCIDFRKTLLSQMIIIFSNNLNMIFSEIKSEVIHIQQWFYLIIRFATSNIANKSKNNYFGSFLLSLKGPITQIFHRLHQKISYHKEAFDIYMQYLYNLKFHLKNNFPNDEISKYMKLFTNIHPSIKPLYSYIYILLNEDQKEHIKLCHNEFYLLLKSGKKENIKKAINILTNNHQTKEYSNQFYKSYEQKKFNLFFKQIELSKKEIAKDVISTIPDIIPYFLNSENNKDVNFEFEYISKSGIPLYLVLSQIEKGIRSELHDEKYLFILLNEIQKENDLSLLHPQLISKYISLLIELNLNAKTKNKVIDLFKEIKKHFKDNIPLYFTILVLNSDKTKTSNSIFLLNEAKSILEECNDDIIDSIPNTVFSIINNNVNAIFFALALISDFKSNAIKYVHIQKLFNLDPARNSWNINNFRQSYEIDFAKTFYRLIKNIIPCFSENEKRSFLMILHNFTFKIFSLPFRIKIYFYKMMHKIGVKFPYQSLPDIKIPEHDFIHNLTCYILCGIEGNIEFNSNLMSNLGRILTRNKDDEYIMIFSKYYYPLIIDFMYAILRSKSMYLISSFFDTFLKFIQHAYRDSKCKTIEIIRLMAKLNDHEITQKLIESSKIKLFGNELDNEIINLFEYYHIIHKTIKESFDYDSINIMIEYLSQKACKALFFYDHIQHVLKNLSIISKMDSRLVREKILNNNNLNKLMLAIYEMISNENTMILINFQKELKKIFTPIASEAINFILEYQDNNYFYGLKLLEQLSNNELFLKVFSERIQVLNIEKWKTPIYKSIKNIIKANNDKNTEPLINTIRNNFKTLTSKIDYEQEFDILRGSISVYLYIIKTKRNISDILCFTKIFKLPIFTKTVVYHKFNQICYNMPEETFSNYFKAFTEDESFYSIFIKFLLVKTNPTNKDIQIILNKAYDKLLVSGYELLSLKIINTIFKKYASLMLNSNFIIMKIPFLLKLGDARINLQGLKLSLSLLKANLLPNIVLDEIVQHLLTFRSFLGNFFCKNGSRFYKYSSQLLGGLKKPFSEKTKELISIFFLEETLKPQERNFSNILNVLTNIKDVSSVLPYDVYHLIAKNTKIFFFKKKPIRQMIKIRGKFILALIQNIKSDAFHKLMFKYIKTVTFDIEDNYQDYIEIINRYYLYILQNPITCIKESFIAKILNGNRNQLFSFSCIILNYCSKEFIEKNIKYLECSFLNFLKESKDDYFQCQFLQFYVKQVFNYEKLYCYISTFITQCLSKSEYIKLLYLSKAFMKNASPKNKKKFVLNFWNQLNFNENSIPLIRYLICSLKYFESSFQMKYLKFIISSLQDLNELFISAVCLIKSKKVNDNLKAYLIDYLILHSLDQTPKRLQRLINIIFTSNLPNKSKYVIQLSMYCSYLVYGKSRNKIIQFVQNEYLKDKTELERFLLFLKYFPIEVWHDEMLVLFILTIKESKYQDSLICYSHLLVKATEIIVTTFLEEIIPLSEDNLNTVFLDLLKSNNSQFLGYFFNAMENLNISTPFSLRTNVIKKTNILHFFNNKFKNKLSTWYLYPNKLNDMIFNEIISKTNITTSTALAQFFLSNYKEACEIGFNEYCNFMPILQKIKNISLQFTNSFNFTTKEEFSNVYTKYKNQNFFISENLQNIYCINKNNVSDDSLSKDLSSIETCNIINFRESCFSIYQKENVLASEIAIQIVKNKLSQSNESICYKSIINPVFVHLLDQLVDNNKMTRLFDNQNDNNQIIFFSPSIAPIISRISGYSPNGYVATSFSTIQEIIQSFNNDANNINPKIFADFLFSLIKVQSFDEQLINIISLCLSNYSKTINSNYLDSFIASSRLITLFKISLAIGNKYLLGNISKILSNLKEYNKIEYFKIWYHQIVNFYIKKSPNNELFKDLIILIENNRNHFETVYYFSKNNSNTARKDMEPFSRLEKFFDYIFSIDFENFQKQKYVYSLFEKILNLSSITKDLQDYYNSLPTEILNQISPLETLFSEIHNNKKYNTIFELVDKYIKNYNDFEHEYNVYKELIQNLYQWSYNFIPKLNNFNFAFNFINDVYRISDDKFLLDCHSISSSHKYFIVQKVISSIESVTLSYCFNLIDQIFSHNYSTLIRNIYFPNIYSFEIGTNYIIYPLPCNVSSVYSLLNSGTSKKDENYLLNYFQSNKTRKEFFSLRKQFVNSFALSEFLRYVFAVSSQNLLISLPNYKKAYSFPIQFGDYNSKSTFCPNWNKANIPKELSRLFGKTQKGELMLAMSSIAQAFVDNIESVQSCLEVFLTTNDDIILNDNNVWKQTELIEKNILDFAPPKSEGASVEDSQKWYSFINEYVPSWL